MRVMGVRVMTTQAPAEFQSIKGMITIGRASNTSLKTDQLLISHGFIQMDYGFYYTV
jgi:hypothetical protein